MNASSIVPPAENYCDVSAPVTTFQNSVEYLS